MLVLHGVAALHRGYHGSTRRFDAATRNYPFTAN